MLSAFRSEGYIATHTSHDLDHHVRYLDHIQGQGDAFFEKCRSIGLEGILSKKSDSKYISGRTDTWLKSKSFLADDFLIVGYLQARGSRTHNPIVDLGCL